MIHKLPLNDLFILAYFQIFGKVAGQDPLETKALTDEKALGRKNEEKHREFKHGEHMEVF